MNYNKKQKKKKKKKKKKKTSGLYTTVCFYWLV